jgi:hypothetical protein
MQVIYRGTVRTFNLTIANQADNPITNAALANYTLVMRIGSGNTAEAQSSMSYVSGRTFSASLNTTQTGALTVGQSQVWVVRTDSGSEGIILPANGQNDYLPISVRSMMNAAS